ncbi:MAG: fused MFS/spermidine synthase [Pseudomonadota bacterium]|nr:fused MFS/spermidine synthase [Pseudomonadota bacterium]
MQRALVFVVAGWSGFFVMALELLSGRILAPSFGNGIYVWGGIITIFMVALAVGYLLGGRFSIHNPSLRRLALLLMGSALASLPVLFAGDAILDRVFDAVHDPRYGSLLSVTMLFFAPVVLCGMVSPYAVRLLVREHALSGHYAGLLYFISTFGSAAGTLMTSFYLVLMFEIREIIGGLIAISIVLGLFTLITARSDRVAHA